MSKIWIACIRFCAGSMSEAPVICGNCDPSHCTPDFALAILRVVELMGKLERDESFNYKAERSRQ